MEPVNPDTVLEIAKNLDYSDLSRLCSTNKQFYQLCREEKFKPVLRAKAREYDQKLLEKYRYTAGIVGVLVEDEIRKLNPTGHIHIKSAARTGKKPTRELLIDSTQTDVLVTEIIRSADTRSILQDFHNKYFTKNPDVKLDIRDLSDGRSISLRYRIPDANTRDDVDQDVIHFLSIVIKDDVARWKSRLDDRISKILHDALYHAEPYTIATRDGQIEFVTEKSRSRFYIRTNLDILSKIPNDGHIDGNSRYWILRPGHLKPEDLESRYLKDLSDLKRGVKAEFDAYGTAKRLLLMYFTGNPELVDTKDADHIPSGEPYWKD